MSAPQPATPALLPGVAASQGQGHLLPAGLGAAWTGASALAPTHLPQPASMLGATALLLALLPGTSTLPSGPPGM